MFWGVRVPVCPLLCLLITTGSELAGCLSRSIQQSYHAVQEQFLAQARDLLMEYDPHAEPAVVGQPLPLDTAFYQRVQENKVQVGLPCAFAALLRRTQKGAEGG